MTAIPARAAVLNSIRGPLEIQSVIVQEPRADEIRVRLVATGICHTDLIMAGGALRAEPPVILGHEGAGIVESVGANVTTHAVGDAVVLSFAHCGQCECCVEGAPSYCHEFGPRNFACQRADGTSSIVSMQPIRSHFFGQSSFATYAVCDPRNAIRVRKDVPLELLGPLGCGFQTGAGAVINVLNVEAGASIAVFGAGAVGLSAIMAAAAVGATTIVAIDRNPSRLELARELGATHQVLFDDDYQLSRIQQIVPRGVRYALDTTGVPAVVSAAIEALSPRGVCGLVAGGPGATAPLPFNHMFVGGRTVRGIMEGDVVPASFIPMLIDLYAQGRFPFDKLIRFYSLDDINLAFADAASGEVVKPVIKF